MSDRNIIKVLFVIRVCLWIWALGSTLYWMKLSSDLHKMGIFDVVEFAKYFRPVFYPCVIIAFVSIAISFALYAVSRHISKKNGFK